MMCAPLVTCSVLLPSYRSSMIDEGMEFGQLWPGSLQLNLV